VKEIVSLARFVPLGQRILSKISIKQRESEKFFVKGQKETGTVYRFHRLAIFYNTCRHERQDSVHKNL